MNTSSLSPPLSNNSPKQKIEENEGSLPANVTTAILLKTIRKQGWGIRTQHIIHKNMKAGDVALQVVLSLYLNKKIK